MVVCNKKADGVNNKVKATLRKEKNKDECMALRRRIRRDDK